MCGHKSIDKLHKNRNENLCNFTIDKKNFLYFCKKRLTSAAGYGIIGGPFASAAGPFCQLCKLYKNFTPNLCNLYT